MPKATVNMPDGTLVTIEGNLKEVEYLLDFFGEVVMVFAEIEKFHGYIIEKIGKGYRCHIQRTSRSEWIRATKDSDTATQAVLEALKADPPQAVVE